MLKIREAQQQALRQAMKEARFPEFVRQTRSERPELCGELSDEELLDVIRWSVARAPAIGFTADADQLRFTWFVLEYGRDYETDESCAWASRILDDFELVGAQKLDRIAARRRASAGEGR